MFSPNYNDRKTQDRKLAAVAYLRENATANKHRLLQVRSILDGAEPVPYNTITKDIITGEQTQVTEEKKRTSSFRSRVLLCLLTFVLMFAAKESRNTVVAPYIQEIKTLISADYSDNLFDFFRQIPYTLDYEKINVK